MTGPTSRHVLLGLVFGALARVALLPGPGSPDVDSWKLWTFAGGWDVTGMYGVGGEPPERGLLVWREMRGTTEYPPLGLYEMAAVGRVYREIDPSFSDSALLTVLVKTPGIVAELALVLLLLTWGRRLIGDPAARWTALAVWLNPAVIINGAGLGYLDAEMAMPATAALLAAGTGYPAIGGALIAAAVLTKAQAVFVLPVVGLAVFWRHRSRAVPALMACSAAGVAVTAVVILPFAVRHALPNMIQALGRLASHDMVSGNGLNAWWIVTWLIRSSYAAVDLGWMAALTEPVRILQISRMMEVGYPNPKVFGTLLVAGTILWLLWRGRTERPLAGWAFLAGWSVFAYFLLGVQVHENHLYLAVPVLALAAGLDPRFRPAFWAVSLLTAFNMYIFYGLGDGSPPLIDRRWTGVDMTVLASVAGIWIFARGITTGIRKGTEPFSTDRADSGTGLD